MQFVYYCDCYLLRSQRNSKTIGSYKSLSNKEMLYVSIHVFESYRVRQRQRKIHRRMHDHKHIIQRGNEKNCKCQKHTS